MAKYTATYTHEDDGWWTVRIKELQGVHSQGRSISQARNRVREALSLFVDEESRCCPFFSYEQMEEPNGVILRVINPPAPAVQTDA